MYVVYKHINKLTNEVFYVGMGSYERAHTLKLYARNDDWTNIIRSIGRENVEVELVATNLNKQEALKLEQETALYYRSIGQAKCCRKFGNMISPETRAKISESSKGKVVPQEVRKKISKSMSNENNPFFGREHTDESKHMMKVNQPGAKMVEVTFNNGEVKVFETLSLCADALGMNYGNIGKIIRSEKPYKTPFKKFKHLEGLTIRYL